MVLSGNRLLLFIFYPQKYLQSQGKGCMSSFVLEFNIVHLRNLKPPLNSSHIGWKESEEMVQNAKKCLGACERAAVVGCTEIKLATHSATHSASRVPQSAMTSSVRKKEPSTNSRCSHRSSPVCMELGCNFSHNYQKPRHIFKGICWEMVLFTLTFTYCFDLDTQKLLAK